MSDTECPIQSDMKESMKDESTPRICGPCESVMNKNENGEWVCPRQSEHQIFVVSYVMEGEVEVEAIDAQTAKGRLLDVRSLNELCNEADWNISTIPEIVRKKAEPSAISIVCNKSDDTSKYARMPHEIDVAITKIAEGVEDPFCRCGHRKQFVMHEARFKYHMRIWFDSTPPHRFSPETDSLKIRTYISNELEALYDGD